MHYFYLFLAQLILEFLFFFFEGNNSDAIADQQTGDLEVLYFMK